MTNFLRRAFDWLPGLRTLAFLCVEIKMTEVVTRLVKMAQTTLFNQKILSPSLERV